MSPHELLLNYGYVGIVAALILEFLLIPFPAETILVVSGFMWHEGLFHIVPLLVIATLASWTGSYIAYWIGRRFGRPVLLRYGRYVKLDEKKLLRAEHVFARYSIAILGIGRFIAYIRVLIAYVAGINKINQTLYLIITIISASLWAATFIMLGAVIGAEWHRIALWIMAHRALSAAVGVILVAALVWWWIRKRKKAQANRSRDAESV